MTRFVSPDLAGLPPPAALEAIDFEQLLASRLADLGARALAKGLPDVVDVLTLESEPLVIAQETAAWFEILQRQRINEAVRAVMIATAANEDLDQLAATFYGVARLVLTPADPSASPPVAEVKEDDDTFRARALLSLEARSTCGPEGAYIFHALESSAEVRDAACYSEEDDALYANGDPVLAPEILIVVLARTGSGVPSAPLLATVLGALSGKEVRPIGDVVTVEPAAVTNYVIQGVIKHAPGADPGPLLAAANARAQAYADARYRLGRRVQRLGVGAALKVTDVEEVELLHPAADIDPGSKGAARCTSIVITAEVADDDWRDVP